MLFILHSTLEAPGIFAFKIVPKSVYIKITTKIIKV